MYLFIYRPHPLNMRTFIRHSAEQKKINAEKKRTKTETDR